MLLGSDILLKDSNVQKYTKITSFQKFLWNFYRHFKPKFFKNVFNFIESLFYFNTSCSTRPTRRKLKTSVGQKLTKYLHGFLKVGWGSLNFFWIFTDVTYIGAYCGVSVWGSLSPTQKCFKLRYKIRLPLKNKKTKSVLSNSNTLDSYQ